jgi:hypothetical protein
MTLNVLNASLVFGLLSFASKGQACSIAQTDSTRVVAKMAAAIADQIGADVAEIDVADITAPQTVFPLVIGADCSGLSAAHHSSGFSLILNGKKYEGVAVLMGYWYNNPVAVHFKSYVPR